MTSTIAFNGGMTNSEYKGSAILRHHSNGISYKHHSLENNKTYCNGISVPTRSASDVCTFIHRNGDWKASGVKKDGNANLTSVDNFIPNGLSNNNHPKLKQPLYRKVDLSQSLTKTNNEQSDEESESEDEILSPIAPVIVNTKQKVKRNEGISNVKLLSFNKTPERSFHEEEYLPDSTNLHPKAPYLQRTILEQQRPNSPSTSQASSPRSTGLSAGDFAPSPEIQQLKQQFFAPGVRAYFQRKTQLPILTRTDTCILSRKPSLADASEQLNKVQTKNIHNRARRQRDIGYYGDDQFNRFNIRNDFKSDDLRGGVDINLIRACWHVILAFMGDAVTVEKNHSQGILNNFLPMRKKTTKENSQSSPKLDGEVTRRPKSMYVATETASPISSTSSASGSDHSFQNPNYSRHSIEGYTMQSAANMTVLQKVHFLCKVGLKLPFMRDEIYCMIVKQIVANPSLHSTARGWILLSLISGIFLPSLKVFSYIKIFVDKQKHEWSCYCAKRMKRNLQNGLRSNTPCSLEVQGAKSRQPMKMPIICSDKSLKTVPVDPATTSKEIVKSVADKLQLQDEFGYSLVMVAENKIVPLGADSFQVMDAISQIEAYCHSKNTKPSWRLYHRRDIFSPRDNIISTCEYSSMWLMFSQICGGIYTGEYVCKKASDLALLVAHKYCLRYGLGVVDHKRVQVMCEETIPPNAYKEDRKNWILMVYKTLEALSKKPNFAVKTSDIFAQIVRFGIKAFRNTFTRIYHVNNFAEDGDSCTYTSDLLMTINHYEITVKQGQSSTSPHDIGRPYPSVLMSVNVKDLKKVTLEPRRVAYGSSITIQTTAGPSYTLTTVHGEEIYGILFRYIRDISGQISNESEA